jgi:hypothetical protein
MSRLLTHTDGRLRTGRVTFLVFVGLLIAMGILFKVNSSVDQAVLAVKHVFEPAAVEPEKRQGPVKPDPAMADTPSPKSAAKTREAEKHDSDQGKKEMEPAGGSQGPVEVKSQKTKENPPTYSSVDEQAEQTPVDVPEPEVKTALREESPEKTEKGPTEIDLLRQEPRVSEEGTAENLAAVEKESSSDARVLPESRGDEVPHPGFDKAGLKRLARLGAEESPVKAQPGPGKIDVSEKLSRPAVGLEKTAKKSPPRNRQTGGVLASTGHVQADPKKGEVTVDQQRYMALFKSWRAAGSGNKETEKIPLRVQNLRESYELFQMKVIAVVRGDTFLDLSDGTRVAEPSLAEYSTTLFRVDRPWDKWAEALASAGVRRDERVEVRYYMYDFIKDAIYARVNQAVSWCREKGLIGKDLPASSVDVLGRAYVIHRQGGGRFGVFVPVSLDARDGRTVTIDPVCFRGQADVEALRDAGVL